MLARISVPEDYSATQLRRWTALDRIMSEQFAEGEDQSENPTVKSIYEIMIGLWPNFGDSIVGGNWQKPTPYSATAGDLKLAVKLVHTISNTDFLASQGSAPIANNALAPANNPAIDAAISQIEEFRSRKDGW